MQTSYGAPGLQTTEYPMNVQGVGFGMVELVMIGTSMYGLTELGGKAPVESFPRRERATGIAALVASRTILRIFSATDLPAPVTAWNNHAPSTMMVSTSPAPLRRNAAALSYSGDVKQATPCSSVGNSITMKRWNLSGPSMIR